MPTDLVHFGVRRSFRFLLVTGHQEQFGGPEDAVERGAKLVRNEAQEIALGLVQYSQSRMGLGQFTGAQGHRFLQVGVVVLQFPAQPGQLQMDAHPILHVSELVGLGDVIHAAHLERLDLANRTFYTGCAV